MKTRRKPSDSIKRGDFKMKPSDLIKSPKARMAKETNWEKLYWDCMEFISDKKMYDSFMFWLRDEAEQHKNR